MPGPNSDVFLLPQKWELQYFLSINLAAPPCSQVFLDNTGDVALALRKSFLYLITLQDSTSIFFLCGLYPGVDLLWLFWDPALPLL